MLNINFIKKDDSENRGFILKIYRQEYDKICIEAQGSLKGQDASYLETHDGNLTIICIGHVYAIDAKTFSVQESLQKFADIYNTHGIDGVFSLIGGGIFSLLIIDKKKQKLFSLTDFLANMPLFHFHETDCHIIGSNQFDFLNDYSLSSTACAEYLTYGYLIFHQSLFQKVERMGPGQLLTISLDSTLKYELTKEMLPKYIEIEKRVTNEKDAVENLDSIFSNYFARLNSESLVAGLSGGYDSRLIAAYCRNKPIKLVTYDNPSTSETYLAQIVAKALGHKTDVINILPNAPVLFSDDFYYGTSTSDSLETSHMLSCLNELCKYNPTYIIDGHIGDLVIGGGLYSKLKNHKKSILKYILGRDQYLLPIQESNIYVSRMLQGYGRKISGVSPKYVNKVKNFAVENILSRFKTLENTCETDADMTEMLLHIYRGALLTSGGPVTFMRRNYTLCPFIDVELFRNCMSISKTLRSGDRLYNAFYRYKFPELSNIPKESSGGKASQNLSLYRITHLKTALSRKIMGYFPNSAKSNIKAGGSTDSFIDGYVDSILKNSFFEKNLSKSFEQLSEMELFPNNEISGLNEDKTLFLRYISLALLLN